MTREPVVRIGDIQNAGFCVRGARAWFKARNLDFKRFVRHGMPLDEFAKIDCEYVRRVLARRAKQGRV